VKIEGMAMAATPKTVCVYVVYSLGWLFTGDYSERWDDLAEQGGWGDPEEPGLDNVPLQSFLTRRQAEEDCRRREAKERADKNPFDYGGHGGDLEPYTTLPPGEVRARLQSAGLKPPAIRTNGRVSEPGLRAWWEGNVKRMTPEQKTAVWEALDRVRFHVVLQKRVPLES
jgi:hypothetical protein